MSDNGLYHNEKRVDSPLSLWPGYIVLPVEISAAQFDTYWRKLKEQEVQEEADREAGNDDPTHQIYKAWATRYHIIQDWKIEGLKAADVDETGLKLPSTKIMLWAIHEANVLINDAWSLPKSPAPSNDIGDSTEQE
jgi:hypothetical protein